MACHIGRIIIVKNEGTVIFGDNANLSPNGTSMNNGGSPAGDSGEISLDNSRFSLTIPLDSQVPEVMESKFKKKARNCRIVQGSNVKRGHRSSDT